jgi:hypothetical protein
MLDEVSEIRARRWVIWPAIMFIPIHIDVPVAYVFVQFYIREPMMPVRLPSSLRDQYHVDIVPDTL